jgi:hypothetical protein
MWLPYNNQLNAIDKIIRIAGYLAIAFFYPSQVGGSSNGDLQIEAIL